MRTAVVCVLLALIPTVSSLSPSGRLQVHHALDPLIDRYNPAAVGISALAAIALLLLRHNVTTKSAILLGVGLVGSLGVAITSLGFNMRINRMIRGWKVDAVPAEYGQVRQRWNRFHALRTALGLLALGCYIASALAR